MQLQCRSVISYSTKSYSTNLSWIHLKPEDIRIGHVIKYGYIKLPQIEDILNSRNPCDILKTLSKYNEHANKLFKIVDKLSYKITAKEVDHNLQITHNAECISLPNNNNDFIVCKLKISEDGDNRIF